MANLRSWFLRLYTSKPTNQLKSEEVAKSYFISLSNGLVDCSLSYFFWEWFRIGGDYESKMVA